MLRDWDLTPLIRHWPGHSRVTISRNRQDLPGHQRTRGWSISYSRGHHGSLSDT
jgi:hypothetical protein